MMIVILNGARKQVFIHEFVRMKLMIKHYTDVSNYFCSRIWNKCDVLPFSARFFSILWGKLLEIIYNTCIRMSKFKSSTYVSSKRLIFRYVWG